MKANSGRSQVWYAVGAAIVLAAVLSSCSEQIVYRDRAAYEEPPAGAGNFLGYSSVEAGRTTCGNCHAGKQALWSQTAHAGAWATLQGSPARAAECEACHSVTDRGNVEINPDVGYTATGSDRYHDVQCESCHGPGLTHVLNPDAVGNKPLAPISVGTDLTLGCGECHSGTHRPFAEDWAASRHANLSLSRATNPSCQPCHEGRGALQQWGVQTVFLEKDEPTAYAAVTCAVCHDPHNATNPGQLRFPMDVPNVEINLCMKCHYRRSVPEVNSSSGPHSPQGPVLLGEAGWVPPNFQYPPKSLVGSHGSDTNPRLCATCHVNNYVITDPATGEFTFRATGHRFDPIPCVNAQGIPTGSTVCEITERSFRACVQCHTGGENSVRAALLVARDRLERLADEVEELLALVPSSEFSTTDNRISTAEGSRFNMQLARQPGSPIHNPFLCEALLLASIEQMETEYGLVAAANLEMRPLLAPPPGLHSGGK